MTTDVFLVSEKKEHNPLWVDRNMPYYKLSQARSVLTHANTDGDLGKTELNIKTCKLKCNAGN